MSIKNCIIMLSIACISTNSYCNEIINNNSSEFVTINDGSAPKPQEQQLSLQNYDIDYYKNENNNLNNKIESLTKNVEQIKIDYNNELKGYNITMKENIEQNIKIKSLLKTIEELQNNNTEKDTEIKSLSKTIKEMKSNNKDVTDQNIKQQDEIKSLLKTIEELKSNNEDITDKNIKQQDEIKSLSKTIEEMKNNNKDITDKNIKQQNEIKSLLKNIEEIKDHNNAIAQYNIEVINFAINNHLDNIAEFLSKNKIRFTYANYQCREERPYFQYRDDDQQTVCLRYQKTVESNCNSYSNCSTKELQENTSNLLRNLKLNMGTNKEYRTKKLDDIIDEYISLVRTDFTGKIDHDIKYFTDQKQYLNKLLEELQFLNNINTEKDNPMLKYKKNIKSYVNDYLDPIIQELSEVREIPKNIKLDESIIKINKYKENIQLEMQNMLDNVNINYEDSINLMNNVCNRLKDIFIQEGNIKNAINEINKFTSSDKRKELFKKSITKEKDITSNNKSLEKSQKKVMQSNKFAKYEYLFENAS